MKYGDEELITSLNSYKKDVYGDIHDTLYVKEIPYSFKRYNFFDGKVNIMLPIRFIDMPDEIVKIKYSRLADEYVIKTNEKYNIDIVLELVKKYDGFENVETEINKNIDCLKKIQPLYCFYESKVENKLGWYDFRNSAIDCQLYNLFFIIDLGEDLLLGKFVCNILKSEIWKKIFLTIISTINESELVKQ